MKNLKKLLAILVVVAVMTTSMLSAFAAAPADVVGTDYEGAVSRLVALGVITGRPDGTFAPTDSISRSEFAAVIVRALGYEAVAATAKGVTKFSDVSASYWASGYINLATTLGIIKGKPDGTFAPNDKVLVEEAVTMIVRALGMDAFAVAKGGYPAGYLVVGNDVGFTKGVKAVAGLAATRGTVAQFVDNAKAEPIYVQRGFGDSQIYEPGKETFLSKLGMEKSENPVIVTSTPEVSDLDEGYFAVGNDKYEAIGLDVEALLGKKADLWTNSDDQVVLAEVKANSTVTATVYNSYTASTLNVKVAGKNKDYTVLAGAGATLNQKAATVAEALAALSGKDEQAYEIKLTLDKDSKVTFVSVMAFGVPEKLTSDPVVNKVAKSIKVGTSTTLRNDGDDAKKVVIVKDGEKVDYTALKKDDVIMVAINNSGTATKITDDYIYIKATSKTVTGELQAAKPNKAAAESVKVDGTFYDVSVFTTVPGELDVTAFIGKDVTLTFDPIGNVYGITTVTTASANKYAVVLASDETTSFGETVYKVKVLTVEGDKIVYNLKKGVSIPSDGTLVKYNVNSDGIVDTMVAATGTGGPMKVDTDKYKLGTAYVKTNVVVFAKDGTNYKKINWTDIEDGSTPTVTSFNPNSGEIEAILLTTYASVSSDTKYAYVADIYEVDGPKYVNTIWTLAGEETKTTTNATYAADAGDVIKYTIDASGKMAISKMLPDVSAVTIGSVDGTRRIKVGSDYYYFTKNTIIVFDSKTDGADVEALTVADLYKDMKVKIYTTDETDSIDIAVLVVTER